MSKTLVELITFLTITQICHSIPFAAEAKQPAGWDKILEPAKKEGKIVIAIPPAAELRREMEIVVRQNSVAKPSSRPTRGK